MLLQGLVMPPPSQSQPDGITPVSLMQGKQTDLIVSELHGKYFTQCYRGNVYDYGTPLAGVTLTTTGSTVQTFGIFNPAGSNRLIVPTKCRMGVVGATLAVDAPAWCVSTGLGTGIAGTSPLTAATYVTAMNARTDILGSVGVGRVFSTITLAAAPSIKRYFGTSWGAPLATTAATFGMMVDEFDGDTIVGPGTALILACPTAPGGALNLSLTWVEVPA